MKKEILGANEIVKIKDREIFAKIDTGAEKSSIALSLAKDLGLMNEIMGITKIKSSNGEQYRPIISAKIRIKDKFLKVNFTVAKRLRLRYPILIGKDVLKGRFLVDVSL